MESDSNQTEINIATGDSNIVNEVIQRVNSVYKTNFAFITTVEKGGVEFAIVEKGSSTIDEVFLLGYYYGAKVKELRDKNKIDW